MPQDFLSMKVRLLSRHGEPVAGDFDVSPPISWGRSEHRYADCVEWRNREFRYTGEIETRDERVGLYYESPQTRS